MADALGIRITDLVNNSTEDRVFPRLPVRIGRNVLNNLKLDHPFVSQFHAVLENQNGALVLRDLGSTNGTMLLDSSRVPANQVVDLAQNGFGFRIVSLTFQTFTVRSVSQPPASSKLPPMRVTSMLQAAPADLVAQLQRSAPPEQVAPYKALLAKYREAWGEFFAAVQQRVTALPAGAQAAFLQQLQVDSPQLKHEPDFQRLLEQYAATGFQASSSISEERVALHGLKELAGEYSATGALPESPDDLVRFLSRIRDSLDVFFRCFVQLRDGHQQFESDMAIQQGNRRSFVDSPRAAVETAANDRQLGAALLNFRDAAAAEATVAVESTFADVMIYQVAMLNGVMTGVKSLLSELSPAALEQYAQDPKTRVGLGVGPLRYKSLWKLYERRHADYADEEKQLFSMLFGAQFARAYGQSKMSGQNAAAQNPGRPRPMMDSGIPVANPAGGVGAPGSFAPPPAPAHIPAYQQPGPGGPPAQFPGTPAEPPRAWGVPYDPNKPNRS